MSKTWRSMRALLPAVMVDAVAGWLKIGDEWEEFFLHVNWKEKRGSEIRANTLLLVSVAYLPNFPKYLKNKKRKSNFTNRFPT